MSNIHIEERNAAFEIQVKQIVKMEFLLNNIVVVVYEVISID